MDYAVRVLYGLLFAIAAGVIATTLYDNRGAIFDLIALVAAIFVLKYSWRRIK